ncbi:MAG: putative toxin-antitoxin system toxin component, PIN family [candidate division KSB1 bacterium]|nr:putative toxin-antitoxin system toxin component, PIN family [candidate division KSB1 bacterium]MDZ7367492.1 putative toxin-antitoxin system toxin component, PIN family [candidate division KSB1 bacterium]MDZ7404949.1 putative toxin-antitoxin system toxin component, PIN family [candidate division KSB1 bacterium]
MIVTVDTNVIFAALYSKTGASHRIFRLIVDEKLALALSVQTYFEYYDVLTRDEHLKRLNLSIAEIEDVLDLLALLAKKHKIYYLLRPNLVDEKDNLFVECAFASNSEYLITANVRDFKSGELKGFKFQVITPGDFYQFWRREHE